MALITERPFAPITYRVIGCAIEVHKKLGPGVLEEPVCLALAHEMRLDVKMSGKPAGLLINFNVHKLKDGIVRILNDRPEKP